MITEEDKIRKAHEIYYRRNGMKYRSEDTEQSSTGIGKNFNNDNTDRSNSYLSKSKKKY